MKEKIKKIMTSKWAYIVYAIILALLLGLQELALGTVGAYIGVLGFVGATIAGAFVELCRKTIMHDEYNVDNVMAWAIGGFIGAVIVLVL